jgi:transcriptional regulator with XRE-family HTH domain
MTAVFASNDHLPSFAERVARARIARGFKSQRALADRLGLSNHTVSVWEKGRNFPGTAELYSLCQVLGVTSDWLLFGEAHGLSREAYGRR